MDGMRPALLFSASNGVRSKEWKDLLGGVFSWASQRGMIWHFWFQTGHLSILLASRCSYIKKPELSWRGRGLASAS